MDSARNLTDNTWYLLDSVEAGLFAKPPVEIIAKAAQFKRDTTLGVCLQYTSCDTLR